MLRDTKDSSIAILFKEIDKIYSEWLEWKKNAKSVALAPDIIVRYFINPDKHLDKIFELGRVGAIRLVVIQTALIDALYAIKKEELDIERLIEFLKVVDVEPTPIELKKIFTKDEERIKHLRKLAMEIG